MISCLTFNFFNFLSIFIVIHSLSPCCLSTVIFSYSNYEFTVPENKLAGEVGRISATSSDGSVVVYHITHGNVGGRFGIDANSGFISTNFPLNFENRTQYNLTVQASTGDTSNTTGVTIIVKDIDDISPICDRYSYHIYVSDDTPHEPPHSLLVLSCSDIDSMSLAYSIVTGNDDSKFELIQNGLYLVSFLNYSQQPSYSLSIRVSDNATVPQLIGVIISILPDPELPPVFTQDGVYTLSLFENSLLGDIFQVSLTAPYTSSPDVIHYSLHSGDIYSQFSINSSTGVLYLRSSLDRETVANYSLSIMAFDMSVYPIAIRTVLATVLITVLDINDNEPMFNPDNLQITISIDTPLNSQFSALLCSDPDSGENSTIASYSLTSDYIRIDSSSGDLFTTDTPFPLDSGPQLTHQVNVECVDLGTPARTGSAVLEISVRQSNIHSPRFSDSSLTFEFEENVFVMARSIFQVIASDDDTDREGTVFYSLTGGADDDLFFIPVVELGYVHTYLTKFDRETKCCYELQITAIDGAIDGFQKTSSVNVTLNVVDENDNNPTFAMPIYFSTIFDNNTAGMELDPVQCNDLDSGSNGDIAYSFVFNPKERLSINSSTGAVSLNVGIRLGSKLSLVLSHYIACEDMGVPSLSSVVAYSIQIAPLDQHAPVFDQAIYNVSSLPENSPVETFVIQVRATDQDALNAGRQLEYSISAGIGSEHFSIGLLSGNITVNGQLNATAIPMYSLVVVATDPTSALIDEASVIITLFNINEHAPIEIRFVQHSLSIPENSLPGIEIAQFFCSDFDEILPDNITYSIIDPTGTQLQFVISANGSLITGPNSTNCEVKDVFDLILFCSDNEFPPLLAQRSIRIRIDGVNEFAPYFFVSSYTTRVNETVPLYTIIQDLRAYDMDCGRDGEIRTYRIISDPVVADIILPWFNITHDGRVFTTEYINSDILPGGANAALMQVVAFDNGVPSFSTKDNTMGNVVAELLVTIVNTNDNAPNFDHVNPILIKLDENYPSDQVFFTVMCSDLDKPNVSTITILPIGNPEPFTVMNGKISVTPGQTIDFEYIQEYLFHLNCSDTLFSTSIEVKILVKPLNDNPIHFESNFYNFTLSRTAIIGEIIGSVVIFDNDIGELDLPMIRIENTTEPENPISISQLGILTLSTSLDNLLLQKLDNVFYLDIFCTDGIFTDTALVEIVLVEGNLNSPQFLQTIYFVEVFEVAPPLTVIEMLICTDIDSGLNGDVEFEISDSSPQNDFSILSDGTLLVLNPLNASQISAYNLLVTCRDRGSPVRSNTTTVSITVIGGNNCPPLFIRTDTYFANISEDALLGSFVGQVFTTDCDLGENGIATYTSLSHVNQFTVSSTDGKIFVRGKLDREIEEVIQLVIQAKDTYFNTSNVFTIILLDVNDNAPQCSPTEYHVTFPETALEGTLVEEFMCYDLDLGNNSQITYIPLTSETPFLLVQNGSVYLQSSTLLSVATDHEFRVQVRDNGLPMQLSTQIVLYVSVAPENLFSPQFQGGSNFSISISEVTLLGSLIFTFFATDDDTGYFESKVTYAISSGNIGGTFQIHPDEGELFLNSPLDFTRIPQYKLEVSASDSAALSPKFSLATITISIDEVNRFFPVCNPPQYIVYVTEQSSEVGIVQLDCSDEDGAVLTYSIDSGSLSLFEINSTSGSLSLVSVLDFESRTNHSLIILVSDGVLGISVPVRILVSPVNEFFPQFSSPNYSFVFREDKSIPSSLFTLIALDSDRDNTTSKHGKVEYLIESGNEEELFSIGRVNGVLYLSQMLDFETNPSYDLTIVAKDEAFTSLSSSCHVYISVMNVNDVEPYFLEFFYIFLINDTHPLSSPVGVVTCSDVDFADNTTQLEYSLTTQTNSFNIDPQSGRIRLAVNVSEISQSIVDLAVSCTDGSLSGYSPLTIFIIGDSPEIGLTQSIYTFYVSESLPVGSSIGHIIVENSSDISLDYRLPVISSLFSIDSEGIINLTSSLDFESQSSHLFSVEVSADSFQTFSVASVLITVNDSNDNSPFFLNAPITLSLEEATSEGIPLLQISCQDYDSSSNGETILSISSGNDGGYFLLSPSGSLQLNRSIDYEAVFADPIIRLQLTCFDRGTPANSVITNLTYFVLPSNEHGPVFQDSLFQFSLREDTQIGTSVNQVVAVDPDRGANHNLVYYQITGGDSESVFLIGPTSGDIILVKSLDHESVHSYLLSVAAIDRERMEAGDPDLVRFTDTKTITIEIIDINDHAPEFSDSFYLATIDDGTLPNTFVYSVLCTDLDEGAAFLPQFELTGSGSDSFSISPSQTSQTDGIIRTNTTISYQTDFSYLLSVSCSDNGVPVLSTQSYIFITVMNLNQFCPVFNQSSARVKLSETIASDSFVLKLNATFPNGDDNDIIFVLVSSVNNLFRINQTSGEIFTTGLLDFETERIFPLEILATNPSFTCNNTANVLIEVTNVNEHSPQFSQSYFFTEISEAANVGNNILFLSCSDSDDFAAGISPNVVIESGDFDGKFSIESQRLMLVSSLDIESRQNYSLMINCTDNGPVERVTTANVYISLLSVNEFSPLFQNDTYSVSISESADVGTEILRLVATDRDSYGHNNILFSIVSGDESDKFILNSDKLLLLDILDFETLSSYTLNISATDSINPAEALLTFSTVIISLIDENDNSPILLPTIAFITLQENTTVGSSILQLSCSDPDAFQSSSLIISIDSGNTNDQFRLNSSNNQLQLNNPLDFSDISLFFLNIACRDNSLSPRVDSSNIKINVVNTISEAITFLDTPYSVILADTTPIGSTVLSVSATDPDSDTSEHIRFSLTNEAELPFLIESISGDILTSQSLLFFSQQTLSLEIQAVDLLTPTRVQFEIAYVTINRTTNSAPVFQRDNYFLNVSELAIPSTRLSTLFCYDNNTDTVEYAIDSGNVNDSFILTALTGSLTIKNLLDFETVDTYVLTVSCLDNGSPRLSATAKVFVSVNPENEFAPEFTMDEYEPVLINEDVLLGAEVITVTAIDLDSQEDGDITYRISEGNSGEHFLISSTSGRIQVAQSLDYELISNYTLRVEARDSSLTNPRSSSATVDINLRDINDNCPRFLNAPYFSQLPANAFANYTVISLVCSDADSGERGRVSLSLQGTVQALQDFQIDSNGVVSLSRNLSLDSSQVYFLVPTCSDNAPSPCVVTTTLTITSADSNLSPPQFSAASYNITLPESYPVLDTLFIAVATDTDFGTNGLVSYSIHNTDLFSINSENGEVYLSQPLDFESSISHTLTILATDGTPLSPNRKSSSALLNVYVTDVNDNRPYCGDTLFTVQYPDTAGIGYSVIQLNCTDPDQGPSGLSYSLSRDAMNLFDVSSEGLLTVATAVTADLNISTVIISVSDNFIGDSVQITNVTIMTVLTGQNDFCPEFSQADYSTNLTESLSPRELVITVHAEDGDAGISGTVRYSIIYGNNLGHFAVSESTGEIVLISSLDRESVASYSLMLTASDNGLPPCTNSTVVTLTITDSNDNRPCLSQPFYTQTLPLHTPADSLILSVTSQDIDIDINSEVSYSLISVNSPNHFSIHPTSGDITLTHNLSNSSVELYQFIIEATDNGISPLSCSSFLTIYTQHLNVFPPVFERNGFVTTISEHVTPLYTLLHVAASDRDSEYLHYSIVSGNEDYLFYLHPDTGALSLRHQLDYEHKSVHNLLVEARDVVFYDGVSLMDTSEVVISVRNENDNIPDFEYNSYSIAIDSTAEIGDELLTVVCTDLDLAPYGNTSLSISDGNSNGYFSLTQSGVISIAQSITALEHEILTVSCSDGEFSVNTTVLIIAAYSGVPQFSRDTYEWYLVENSQLGTSYTEISALSNSTVSFSIVSGDYTPVVSIDSVDGTVYLINPVDRELVTDYTFTLSAVSDISISFSILHIIVTDDNDNKPVIFADSVAMLYSYSAPESVVTFLSCQDSDIDNNALTNLIISAGNEDDLFVLSPGGALLLNRTLGSERVYSLIISCYDSGLPALSTNAIIIVEIAPVNRYNPEFAHNQLVVDVLENESVSSILVSVTAVDRDEGTFGDISYSIVSGNELNLFDINPVTGELSLESTLDFESLHTHTLTVSARDGGYGDAAARYSTADVIIRVFDVNDNIPRLDSDIYSIHISVATTPGSELLRAVCSDADSGDNGEVEYSFVNDSAPFSVANGSIFMALPLEYSIPDSVYLVLECRDRGSPPLVTSSLLRIYIRKDELAPEFNQTIYSLALSESADLYTEIVTITAEDRDAGNNGIVSYLLRDCEYDCPFIIHTVTGVVSIIGALDYETHPTYSLRVQALDLGTFSHTSEATLEIQIINENDNLPQFSISFHETSISENSHFHTPVLSLPCYDLDFDYLSYAITDGLQGTNAFFLSAEGILLVSDVLDYETMPSYSLTVQCSDGRDSASSAVQVSIINVNEHTPTFNQSRYNISLLESLTFGSILFSVLAIDGDADSLGDITYSLVGGNTQQTFGILSTEGTIFLTDSLDYETTPTYSLILFATDGDGLIGRTNIVVEVINVNDNAPVFSPSIYSRVLSIDQEVDVNVIELRCSDRDGDDLVYNIESGNTGNYFNVSQTGLVFVAQNLTGSNQVLILRISCSDRSTLPSAVAIVSINILRDSDCSIQFANAPYIGRVSEDVSINHLVLTLYVNGSSNDVTYQIDTSSVPFYINSIGSSGQILVLNELDADLQDQYIFNVIAIPNDVSCNDPPQTSVTILIEDVNEFSPLITPSIQTIFLEENLAVPQLIAQFQCNDSDASNNDVTFLAGSAGINVDVNGRVTLNSVLDYEVQQQHIFMVMCQDSAVIPKTGTATLHIMVSPQNEFAPTFSLDSYQFQVSESVLPGFVIGSVVATDGDNLASGDGQVSYSLINTYQLAVNDNGDVVVIDVLDREFVPNITFIAVATDNGNVSMSDSATIVVILLDVNDNPPLFHPLVYSVSRDSNQSIAEPLAAIRCTDSDAGINAQLELSFSPGFNLSYTLSDQTGGQGEINASLIALSPPSDGVLTFEIICTDSGNTSLSSTALVSIVVSMECYSPQLFPIYHATIPEDTVTGSVVVNTSAQFDPLCPHEFFIVSGEIGAFAINKTKGDIYVVSSLDFETVPAYEIAISLISLTSTGAKSSTATVFIALTNVNDNSPVIEPSRLIVTFPEDTANNQEIASYSCSDLDSDLLQIDIASGNEDLRFNLNGQGVLTLLNPLDFESIQVHDLFISCAEVNAPGILHTSTAELTVLVSAVNDNEPSFDQSTYSDTVIENTAIGTTILFVSATDNDLTTPHNKTLFELSGANSLLFRVTSEGSLLTADFLDAETNSGRYQFSVLAYNPEPGASTATASVIITLTDVNEDPPVCGGGLVNLELDPGTYNTQAVGSNLVCTDQDISPPSFTATLTGDSSNDATLILTAELSGSSLSLKLSGTISYPQHVLPNQYTLAVSDGGSPALIGYTLVYVRVKPPPGALSFSPSSRSISVREDFPLGEDLIDVGALLTGDDKELADYSTSFPLSVTSEGMVALSSSLDYETRTSYSVEIRAQVSTQFNIFTLNIQVEDVNDNEPVFSAGNILRVSVREDSSPSVVTTIRATDADSGVNGDVRFTQISSTGPIGLFTVSLDGRVTLTGPLDRENTPQYSIQVRASDQGFPSLSAVAVLLITVSDVNDNPPIFLEDSSGIELSVAHTIPKDTVIYTFQVSDLDLNPTFTFSVSGGSSVLAAFGVSDAGDLFIRDDLVNIPSQTFEFNVQVSDGVLTDSISVRILVNIVADVELTLKENSPIGTVVWNSSTYSQGSYVPTENAAFFLTLGNFQDSFDIDSASGQLSNIGEIDYEVVIVYTFIVEIDDPTNPVNTNLRVAVYLLVLDENDNYPVFTQLVSSLAILESDYILPYKLAQVAAVDADSGLYAQLEFHLVYPETGQEATELPFYFTFDGSLYAQGNVDREAYSLLDLLVRVRDKSDDPLSTTTPIQISVLDVNDNSPSFVNLTSPIEIINNLPDNSVFYEFHVSDPDAAENGTLQLSLEQLTTTNPLYFDFNLDQATGLVRLIKIDNLLGLSEDELFFINLRLTVSDQGSPQLSHSQTVTVAVKPYDIRPSFQSDFYWVDLLYSAPVGSVLLTVRLDVELDSIYFLLG